MNSIVRVTTVPISLDKLLGSQLSFMNGHYEITAVSSDLPYLRKVAEKRGVKYFHVEMSRKITPFHDLKAIWKLYRFLKKKKPLIVHTHTPKAGLVGMMAAKLAGVPHRLHTVAGLPLMEASGPKRLLLNGVEKIKYSCATKVYPNSAGLYDFIVQNNFCPPKKLKVVGKGSSNGINTEYFSKEHFPASAQDKLRQQLGLKQDDFVFIFVGRLVKDKGINELVAAFKKLCAENFHPLGQGKANFTDVNAPSSSQDSGSSENSYLSEQVKDILTPKLLLVGPTEHELDPLLPETLSEIETNPHIITTGFQQDVRPYFAVSNALAFPSYREGFPNVVMQAGAMELPCIVTDINGCNEIIENEVNGLIIPTKNAESLQQAMTRLLREDDLYANLQKEARISIESRYSQEKIWHALLEEYRSLSTVSA